MNILITGGASGLGHEITLRMASVAGNNVYFTYCNSVNAAQKITTEFSNTTSFKCDFRNEKNISELKEKITSYNIELLINNAYSGDFIRSYFHKENVGDFFKAFNEDILPVINITQAAINHFRNKKCGKIITILTAALVNTPPIGSAIYVANKAYLKELTKVWAIENAKFNISSNTISPAFMLTNLTSGMDERMVEQMIQSHPLKKLLTVQEVAESVFFLANSSSQINGMDLIINAAANIQ